MDKIYYTLQIKYGGTENPEIEEMKDLSHGESDTFLRWSSELRSRLFTTGFQIQTSPIAWEFISPFRIHTAILLKQDKKYAV